MNTNSPTIRPKQFFHTPKWHLFLSTPFIYAALPSLVLLDFTIETYQHICFPLYGLKIISRSKYFYFDHHNLPKLSRMEKIYCGYCSYANGLAAYFVAIASETEAYWCAIKHEQIASLEVQPHTATFLEREKYQ